MNNLTTSSSSSSTLPRYNWVEPKFGGLRNSFFNLLLRSLHSIANTSSTASGASGAERGPPDILIPNSTVFEGGFPRFQFFYDPATKEVRKETSGTLLQAAQLYSGIIEANRQFRRYNSILGAKIKRRKKRKAMMERRLAVGLSVSDLEREAEESDRNEDDEFVGLAPGTTTTTDNNQNEDGEDENHGSSSEDSSMMMEMKQCDIVAVLIYSLDSDKNTKSDNNDGDNEGTTQSSSSSKTRKSSSSSSTRRITRMEPMTEEMLKEFLFTTTATDPRRQHAVLQQVLPPTEANYTVSRVSWSPSVCLVSRRQSRYPFYDQRFTPAQRLLLFDALQENSVEVHCAATTGSAIEEVCREIALHVNNYSGSSNVNEMLLYFQTSAYGRQVLLFCGGFDHSDNGNANDHDALLMSSTPPSSQTHARNNNNHTVNRLPTSALEGGTIELSIQSDKAEVDQLSKLSHIDRSLQRQFQGKLSDKLMQTSASSPLTVNSISSISGSQKTKQQHQHQHQKGRNVDDTDIDGERKKSLHKQEQSNSFTTAATSTVIASPTNNNSTIELERRVSHLYSTGWRTMLSSQNKIAIAQFEENLRLAEHEIRLIVSSAVNDYFTRKEIVLSNGDDNYNDVGIEMMQIETESIEEIDRLLQINNDDSFRNDSDDHKKERIDLLRAMGFVECVDDGDPNNKKFVFFREFENDNNNNDPNVEGSHHHHQSTKKTTTKTQNVVLSLMEIWLSKFIDRKTEALKQSYAPQIRAAATKMALGLL